MPILCLEGPSAVGKTTTASALEAVGGACVVPEVNLLFERPEDAPPEWYLERQVDRWARAAGQRRRHPLVLLDGDPFQPLWYDWTYGYAGWQGLDALEAFYRPRLVRGELGFPDLYVVLGAPTEALRTRKEADATRRRRGFEAHLRFIAPQRRYFEAMQDFAPGRVRFVEALDPGETVRVVAEAAGQAHTEARPVELFDRLVRWLSEHPA